VGVLQSRRVSRATYPEALAVLAPTVNCVVASGSNIITGIASTAGFGTGWPVEGAAFSAGTTVSAILDGTRVQLSQPAIDNAASAQFFIHGNGNGSTTFNLPNYEDGRALIGLDTAQAQVTGGQMLNATLGEQTHTLTTAELAAHSHGVNDPTHNHPGVVGTSAALLGFGASTPQFIPVGNGTIGGNGTGISIVNAGSGTAHNNLQPSRVARVIIYLGH
jgi:microcystin-dependent protein